MLTIVMTCTSNNTVVMVMVPGGHPESLVSHPRSAHSAPGVDAIISTY